VEILPQTVFLTKSVPVKRWQKMAALGACFRHPFHQSPTRASGRLNHFLGSSAPSPESLQRRPLLTFLTSTSHSPLPPFLRGAYFGSTSSVLKMDLSPSLRIMARGIYRTVSPTGLRPRLLIHRVKRIAFILEIFLLSSQSSLPRPKASHVT